MRRKTGSNRVPTREWRVNVTVDGPRSRFVTWNEPLAEAAGHVTTPFTAPRRSPTGSGRPADRRTVNRLAAQSGKALFAT